MVLAGDRPPRYGNIGTGRTLLHGFMKHPPVNVGGGETHFAAFLEIIGKKVKKRPVFPKKAEKKQNHPKSSAKNTYT